MADFVRGVVRKSRERYESLTPTAQRIFIGYVALHAAVGAFLVYAVIVYTPTGILEQLSAFAENLKSMEYGRIILFGLIVLTSFPPLIGYGTCITLCGFAFGLQTGWIIAASGCLFGGLCAFVLGRTILSPLFASLLSRDKVFIGLSRAVKEKGLLLVVLIRFCPFPYPYSNLFFVSIEAVKLSDFLLATLAITPKLFIHVFVGSRMFSFIDPNQTMDRQTKIINGCSIVFGMALGAFTSWYLYRITMRYVQEIALNDEEDLENGLIHDALLQDVDEMLDEGEEEDDIHLRAQKPAAPRSRSDSPSTSTSRFSPNPAAKRPLVADRSNSTPMLPIPRHIGSTKLDSPDLGRKSEDGNWGGNFSDFDEDEALVSDEEDVVPRGPIRSVSAPGIDKRRD